MSQILDGIKLSSLNGHLICGLCGGYLIDATVLTECIHVYCRSCILKYLTENKVCPLCQTLIHETRPGQALRPDVTLQRIVYKLVPGLLRTEMKRLEDFCSTLPSELITQKPDLQNSDFCNQTLPTALGTRSLSKSPSALSTNSISHDSVLSHHRTPHSSTFLLGADEILSLALTHIESNTSHPAHRTSNWRLHSKAPHPQLVRASSTILHDTIHLLCSASVTVKTLHNLLSAKYQLHSHQFAVDLFLDGECLESSHSLREIAFLYAFPAREQRMCLEFTFIDARLAWWGRPMPRLECLHRPSSVDSLASKWSNRSQTSKDRRSGPLTDRSRSNSCEFRRSPYGVSQKRPSI